MKNYIRIRGILSVFLIVIGVALVIVANDSPYHDPLQYTLIFAIMVNALVHLKKKDRMLKGKGLTVVLLLFSMGLIAQDYSKQVAAFAESFKTKSIASVQPYLSNALQFGEIPTTNTTAIMKNIVTNLPELKGMTIVKTEARKTMVAYDFEGFGKSESFIHFDEEGRIIKIQLVEDLINQEAEARRQQKVPLPSPGELGIKYPAQEIKFPAEDGIVIHGNLYEVHKEKPILLVLHQAGYNRMEYVDIAPKLNDLGYNCLAIDLRSGGTFAGKSNKTNQQAMEKGLKPEMLDAQQDIAAAVDFLNKKYKKKVIVWGSSFSSSLALLEGINNTNIKAIIGCSPGDYFGDRAVSLTKVFAEIDKPYLVTSSKQEAPTLKDLISMSTLKKNQQQFIPRSKGFHGSRAFWTGQEGAEEYWGAITKFLKEIK